MNGKRRQVQRPYRRRGFTLVEVIVVIAIIGILATMVIVRYAGKTDQARQAVAKAQISQIESAVIDFQGSCKRLPRSFDELVTQPGDCPDWNPGGYLKGKSVPKDPWGKEYIYRQEGTNFEVICLGADGQEGGSGFNRDISSSNMDGNAQ
jgi:general secretion pathway protein G